MKFYSRFIAGVAAVAAASTLAACSPIDVFGPRANSKIMALAKQASADKVFGEASGDSTTDPDAAQWRELRAFHAEQLRQEAQRLCGTNENGEAPSSCDVTYGDTDLPASGNAAQLVATTVTAADKVPEESVALVVAQAIDAAAAADLPLNLPGPIENPESIEAAKELARVEYAVAFGLDYASAYADDALQGRIDNLRSTQDERIAALREAVPDLPAREAGYEIPGAPTTTVEAKRFIDKLEDDLVAHWRDSAAQASSAKWREAAILLAAHAQRSAGPAA